MWGGRGRCGRFVWRFACQVGLSNRLDPDFFDGGCKGDERAHDVQIAIPDIMSDWSTIV